MSLAKLLGGAIDPAAMMQHLANGGSIHITINNHKGPDAENDAEDMLEGGKEEPEDMIDPESPPEDMAEGKEEPGMMGAVKRALAPPPKAPSKGVGKGPANPQTKPKSAKLPDKVPKPAPKKPGAPPPKGAKK